ncbi:MAG TPA: hypothetical protein VIL26_07510 [Clostridia bacterium]
MKNRIKCHLKLISLILFLVFFSFAFLVSCDKSEKKDSVFSIEVLFNDENHSDFKAKINEKFFISVTVNDYKELFDDFEMFYAWIDYNGEKVQLNYGNNQVSFNKTGNYQVKVSIIDAYRRLVTKKMPFSIIDDQPPQFFGKINDFIENNIALNAYWDVGWILPDFEIIDDSGESIMPDIIAKTGEIKTYYTRDNKKLYYYINSEKENIIEDTITITATDSSKNKKTINLDVKHNKSEWFVKKYNDQEFIVIDDTNIFKTLFFEGYNKQENQKEKSFIGYKPNNPNKIDNIIIDFIKFDTDSSFELSFEDSNIFKKYTINFKFYDQKIYVENFEFNAAKILVSLNNDNTISVSDDQNTYILTIDNIQNITAAELTMSNLNFNAKINLETY